MPGPLRDHLIHLLLINKQKVLAIIPARGGSKGLPRKNILPLADKPLIAHSIIQANQSKYIDKIILSSEDEEIIKISKNYNIDVPFVRPASLSDDMTSGLDVVMHAIKEIPGYDITVLLQPTSPLRTSKDIDSCIKQLVDSNSKACVSVAESSKSPFWMYELSKEKKFIPLIKDIPLITVRQKLPKTYAINGAVYVAYTEWFKEKKEFINDKTIAYIMPKERSVDIDSKEDFLFVEFLLDKNKRLKTIK